MIQISYVQTVLVPLACIIVFYYLGYRVGLRNGAGLFRRSPFDPDSICGVCGRPEREHISCPAPAQKGEKDAVRGD